MATITPYGTQSGTRYRVRYRKPDGSSTDKRGFLTKREAELWRAENVIQRNAGSYVAPSAGRTQLLPVIARYLEANVHIKPATSVNRVSIASNWITPYWGLWKVADVNRAAVTDWVGWMRTEGAGHATIEKAHSIMHGVLEVAVDQRLTSANATVGVKLPSRVKKAHSYLSHAEVAELVRAIDPRYATLVEVLSYTGLRFGEAAALRVRDVTISRSRLRVENAVTEVEGKQIWGTPKNSEIRTVSFPASLAPGIEAAIGKKQRDDILFNAPHGGAIRLNTWRRRTFADALKLIEVRRRAEAESSGDEYRPFPKVTPHGLRHTAVSLAVQTGSNVKVIQRMVGHGDASLTLNTYADLFDDDLDEVAEKLDLAIRQQSSEYAKELGGALPRS